MISRKKIENFFLQVMERLRNLLNSGVSLGELFATSTELRTTTPKSTINLSTGIILQFSENEKK